jgi:amyloid beta A4 precursor protein-binding family A member 1
VRKTPKVVCHVFESEEAAFIAQSIGQAFQVAYVEFLRANGIDDPAYLREIDYQVIEKFVKNRKIRQKLKNTTASQDA